MKIPNFRRDRKVVMALTIALLCVSPVVAQFGLSIVEDPTETAQVINNLKQAIQIATTGKQTLSTIQSNLTHFSFKGLWQTVSTSVPNVNVQNSYGETAGWNAALNTNSPAASNTAWNMANVQVTSGTYMNGQTPGTSANLSSLAMIEAFDASSPNCLNAVGQYRNQRTTDTAAQESLESDQLDGSEDTNSEIQQLNLLNASDAQQMNEMKSQGQLHACLVEQTTIQNMAQRNAAATAINDNAIAQQELATNNTNYGAASNTWQNYLP